MLNPDKRENPDHNPKHNIKYDHKYDHKHNPKHNPNPLWFTAMVLLTLCGTIIVVTWLIVS